MVRTFFPALVLALGAAGATAQADEHLSLIHI